MSGIVRYVPSIGQAAGLLEVPAVAISRHLHARNGNGSNGSNGKRKPKPTTTESLAEHILRVTPAERVEAAHIVGTQLIWDSMIVPVCEEDRAPAE